MSTARRQAVVAGAIHAGRPYGVVLGPYLVISLLIHLSVVGAVTWRSWFGVGQTNPMLLEKFGKPKGASSAPEQVPLDIGDRPRRYRLNYFAKVVLPQPELIAALPVPTPTPPALDDPLKPVQPTKPVKPPPETPPVPVPTPTPTEGEGTEPFTDVQVGFIDGEDGTHLRVPPFVLRTLQDDVYRSEKDFLTYPAIFLVSDISTEQGMEDLFNWSHFFHDLLHLPGIVTPPYLLAIGEGVNDPLFLTPGLAEDALHRRWDTMQLFHGRVWGDIAYDAQSDFLNGVGVEALPEPQVYMIDLDGYVRIRITGRLDDMSREEITAITTEIKNQWGMNEAEFSAAKFIIFQWQANLRKDKLGSPMATAEDQVPLMIPPAHTLEELTPP